jgi:hypothetical protein
MGPRDTDYDAADRCERRAAAIEAAHDRQDRQRGERLVGEAKTAPVDRCGYLCGLIEMDLRAFRNLPLTPIGVEAAITAIEQRATEIALTVRSLRAVPVAANDKAQAPGAAA